MEHEKDKRRVESEGVDLMMSFGLIKIAEETKEKKEREVPGRVTETLGGAGIGAASFGAATGTEKFYHGTSTENAEKIKSEGLLASMGGTGKAKDIGYDNYVENSKGYVHGTKMPSVAKNYAKMNHPEVMRELQSMEAYRSRVEEVSNLKGQIPEADYISLKESAVRDFGSAQNRLLNKIDSVKADGTGEVIRGRLPYDIYKGTEIDTDAGRSRMQAFKTKRDIPVEAIHGSEAMLSDRAKYYGKNFLNYAKEHPKRLLTGAAGLGIGSTLVADGLLRNEEVPLFGTVKLASSTNYNERMIELKMRRTGCSREEAERTMDIADSQYLSEVLMGDFVNKLTKGK
jgi:hypothetical protein